MYLSAENRQIAKNKFSQDKTKKDKIAAVLQNYDVITDKKTLAEHASSISRLLIEHTAWAGSSEEDRHIYGEEAIKARIAIENSTCIALMNKETNRVDAFIRLYRAQGYSYIGDAVVRTDQRKQGLMLTLVKKIDELVEQNDINQLFFMGGNEVTCQIYQKSFDTQYAKDSSTDDKSNTIMFGIKLPIVDLLKNYTEALRLGAPSPSVIEKIVDKTESVITSVANTIGQTLFGQSEKATTLAVAADNSSAKILFSPKGN